MTSTEQVELETKYQVSWKNIFVFISMGLVIGIFMVHEAQTNTRRLLINGIIELSVDQATTFYWAMSCLMFFLVILSFWGILHRLRSTNRLAITNQGFRMPGPLWSPAERFYPYSSIKSLKIVSISKSRILQGKTTDYRFSIASQNLSSLEEFNKIAALIHQRVNYRLR